MLADQRFDGPPVRVVVDVPKACAGKQKNRQKPDAWLPDGLFFQQVRCARPPVDLPVLPDTKVYGQPGPVANCSHVSLYRAPAFFELRGPVECEDDDAFARQGADVRV